MLIEKKQDDAKKALDKRINGIEGKIAQLKVKEGEIDQALKDLNTKDLYLEAYSRRENKKFNNIPESPSPRNGLEDTEAVLRSFLEKQLGYHDASSVEMLRFKEFTSLRSRRKRGGGKGARTREKGDWGLGTRERLLQRPPFLHFCGRQRPQNSDWLIFDSKPHGNDVI